jgi:hypothetical protein
MPSHASDLLNVHVERVTRKGEGPTLRVQDVARAAFVPMSTLRDMRRGLAPSVCQFARVCVALKLTPRQVLDIIEAAARPAGDVCLGCPR